MPQKIPLILSFLLFSACQNPRQPNPTAAPAAAQPTPISAADTAIAVRESAQQEQLNLGQQLSTIPIQTKATKEERKDFEDGIIPWVNLDSAERRITNLVDPDEIVIPYQKVKIMIDYPLAKPIFFELTSLTKGFTRKQLILAISKKYHQIYDEEEKTAKIKTIPLKDRKELANRNQTDGKYGIWGHDLSDLALTGIIVYQTPDGTILLDLDIDS